jgi:hypothetical protein
MVLPDAAKLRANEAPVAARLAVGAVLEMVNVCATGTLVPIVDTVSCTWYDPPAGVVGTLSIASVAQGFVRSSVVEPSSSAVAPEGTDSTCQRQVTGLPGRTGLV